MRVGVLRDVGIVSFYFPFADLVSDVGVDVRRASYCLCGGRRTRVWGLRDGMYDGRRTTGKSL